MATSKTYKEGNITYTNDGKNIYKNGQVVDKANYKYVPTQVGGSRADTSNKNSQTSQPTTNLQKFLQQNTAPVVDYSSAKNVNVDPNQFNWYKDAQNDAYNKYASMTEQQISSIREQAQAQKDYLTQQLNANRQKYEAQYNTQVNQANNDFASQKANIEKQVYQMYDRANTQASSRGVATSGQNQAMANSVAQYAIGQHNSNASNRDATLSSLYAKLMEQNAGLDSDYAKNMMDVDQTSSAQVNALGQQLASQYLTTQNNIASGLANLTTQERNRLSELYANEANSNQQSALARYNLMAQGAQAQDQQQYALEQLARQQAFEKEKLAIQQQYALEQMAKENEYQRQMAQLSASLSARSGGGYGGGSGKGGSSSKSEESSGLSFFPNSTGISQDEWDATAQGLLAYYESQGHDPRTAYELVRRDLGRMADDLSGKPYKPDLANGMVVQPNNTHSAEYIMQHGTPQNKPAQNYTGMTNKAQAQLNAMTKRVTRGGSRKF